MSIQTRSGPLGWGPKCARLAGQQQHKTRPAKAAQRTDDPAQLDWLANDPIGIALTKGAT